MLNLNFNVSLILLKSFIIIAIEVICTADQERSHNSKRGGGLNVKYVNLIWKLFLRWVSFSSFILIYAAIIKFLAL